MQPLAAFFNEHPVGGSLDTVFGNGRRDQVGDLVQVYPHVVSAATFDEHAPALGELKAIFSTWGMPHLTAEQLQRLPNLEVVFYAAGSVKSFAPTFLQSGVTVSSAWVANAIPVAEFCLGEILLACKGFYRNTQDCRQPRRPGHAPHRGRGVYGETVALIAAGQVGRKLIELLRPFNLRVLVVDPYLAPAEAADLGVELVSLEQAFSQAYVVSNHLPNLTELRDLLNGPLFNSMRPDATFINTGRGAQVCEADMIEVLTRRPDLTVLLDVTYPEPPVPGSPLYELPNVHLTSHIAGSMNDEVLRMADFMIDECRRWLAGEPLRYTVSEAMLPRMA